MIKKYLISLLLIIICLSKTNIKTNAVIDSLSLNLTNNQTKLY